MDYRAYYQLALRDAYGVEFPEMNEAEFARRCGLEQVPEALKALYLTLGRSRICRMHTFIPTPEDLFRDCRLVVIARVDDRVWAVHEEDLHEENPLVQTVTAREEDQYGNVVSTCENDGKTRVALLMAKLIEKSGAETKNLCMSAYAGRLNRFRNVLGWFTRKRMRLLLLAALPVIYVVCRTRILVTLHQKDPWLGELAVWGFLVIFVFVLIALGRLFLYWNIWLGWNDNVRFGKTDDPLFLLVFDLTLFYLRWNHPELWFSNNPGNFHWNPAISLRDGGRRYCQSRYDFITGSDGELGFPGFAPIRYAGGKQCSLLLRSTLDDSGCLKFDYVNDRCRWRLPKPKRVEIEFPEISVNVLKEELDIQVAPPGDVPDELRNLLREKCEADPAISRAWLCAAVMDGEETYLLTVVADGEADLVPLLEDVLKISDRPFNAAIRTEAPEMEGFEPLFSRVPQAE